jgi:SNF2 family DNA or RNA helicase
MQFFHDQPRNLLIYERPSPLVLEHTQGAKQINGSYVAVPGTLRNSQILRWLNYPVAPIITDANYDWPIEPGKTPLAHQKIMANFGVLHPRMFNLSDMGTMKTLATLWAADFLMRQHPAGTFRVIIVAPLSILERVWANAIFTNFLGHRTFEILYGSADKRGNLLEKPADFYIINFDGVGVGAHTRKRFELDGFSKSLAERKDIRLAIVDEASGYRDSTTKRHRIARHVIGKRQYLWLLTGTPTPNAPTDAYGLAKMVNDAFGKSFTSFREETMMKVSNFKWVPRAGGYDIARQLLTPSIRYDIKQVWDGPELTTQQRQVELTAEQKKYFADLKRNLQVVLKSGQPITAANEAAVRTKFIQISLGGIYDENHKSHAIDAKPRVDELKAVLEQAPAKIIVFSPLTNIVDMLYKTLNYGPMNKSGYTCEVVNGNTSQKDRSRIFQAFQEKSEPRVVIADPGCMAHGLDLYAAQTVVWFGPTDRTELYLQANKRAHRPGQSYPVCIVQLVSNKLEQEIFRRLETNTTLQGALLELVREGKF